VREGGFDFGVMVSASHNPAPDNGIKFFSYGGTKLPDEVEDRIEAMMHEPALAPTGGDVGRIQRFADAEDRYLLHLLCRPLRETWRGSTSYWTARMVRPPLLLHECFCGRRRHGYGDR